MKIGIAKEIKNNENRVALPPAGVFELVNDGHEVLVETNAGTGSGITDEEYLAVGGKIVATAQEVWACDMVMKVKEPLKEEYQYFREDLLLFTYLHLAANRELTEELVKSKVNAIAYENVIDPTDHSLPLLAPMSEIAGRMSVQIGAQFLQRSFGGKGILLAGVPGTGQGNVVIIGGGISGMNAAKMALGLGARVTILDVNLNRLKELDNQFDGRVQTLLSNQFNIQRCLSTADLVIGAVLLPGHKAPTLVTTDMVKGMPNGSVIVDIAIDQGGIFETGTEVTTHDNPTYIKEGVIHYAVANMPGAVPQSSTYALSNATIRYARKLAKGNLTELLYDDQALQAGVNTYKGHLTLQPVAEDLNLEYTSIHELI